MRPLLRELPFLRGEAGVLDTARGLAPHPLQALDRLCELAQALAARFALQHVMFDLALSGWADYYDGPLVEVYAGGRADAVGAGGRYDGLTTLYGKPLPVCGAALMLDPLLEGAAPAEKIPAVLVIGDDDTASRRAAELRAGGKIVIQIAALQPDTLADLKNGYDLTDPGGRSC
jgi:ATP phosphoribosyltransferase regulatory subunit